MRYTIGIAALLLALASGQVRAQAPAPDVQTRATEPFKIIGNVYYVGTEGLSSFLVTSPQGSVLIDSGSAETAPLVEASITKLGFQLADIKYLLTTRAAPDRAGGLARLKRTPAPRSSPVRATSRCSRAALPRRVSRRSRSIG